MMITPLSAEKIKSVFGLEFEQSPNLSQVGAAELYLGLIRKMRLKKKLEAVVGKHATKALLQVLVGILAGARSMKDVANISNDKAIKKFFGTPVSETQITRSLKKLMPSQLARQELVDGHVRNPAHGAL